ncbi:MAG TPA: XdhC/CoxI family protein [Miltoncostaeaceae bacterium]|nr:XdhC/CoxI family protein [Miltoncostaeaceae bacterium]
MRDILDTLEGWIAQGREAAIATVVETERSAPREPGSSMAVSDAGEIAGSVTGGCVEPAVYEHAQEVLGGGPPRLATFGIADDEAFEVGLPCGGTVHIYVSRVDPAVVRAVAGAVREERPLATLTTIEGPDAGAVRVVAPDDTMEAAERDLVTRGRAGVIAEGDERVFVSPFMPRPAMYVFGAIDHSAALARMGRFLGYRVTVCDARGAFVTPERFPDVDELVVAWPHEFLAGAPIDERTAVCVLTHDAKFDVPVLKVALDSPAGYIGAMGSSRTTERRNERLREEGVTDEQLARIHAPIGLKIGSRTPEEVAVAIAAEVVASMQPTAKEARAARERV